ncbi:MAG: cytosolic protein [Anaerolineales bacterium]|nr:cytosolic protein [Anaerolineales bacterium]
MNPLDLFHVQDYVNENIVDFHNLRINTIKELKIERLITKNPYLFRAKYITTAAELISSLLDAFLSSSEEKLFGDFLEGLAIFIAETTCGGHKSSAPGVDLEFIKDNIHYIISIKSGPRWGNSSQQNKLEQDLKNAVARIKQSKRGVNVQPVLGICYGKTKTSYVRGYLKVVGQNFWYLISENRNLYTDIIEPIGYRAKEHNESYLHEKNNVINLFTRQFVEEFCNLNGSIDWAKLVKFNSGNFDLDRFLP